MGSPSRRSRFRSRPGRVDSHDARAFVRVALRTRLVRLALAASAVGVLLAAAASARGLELRENALLESGRTGIVVLDLSLSITDEDYRAVRRTLRRVIAEGTPAGLVVFSDVAYELLPPGTPARELEPMLRLLRKPRLGPPVNPWSQMFRAGTRISTALELADGAMQRDGVGARAILLVSDLETAPDDVPALARTVARLRRDDVRLRVVALSPTSHGSAIFEGLLDRDAIVLPDELGADRDPTLASEVARNLPRELIVLGAVLFVALAVHERLTGRLALPRPEAPRSSAA